MGAVPAASPLERTPLFEAHVALGAKMVPFAGYEMPVQYPLGVLKEHLWTREHAGLFDVSHMGIAHIEAADGRHQTAARALETMVPADIVDLKPGQQRYTQLLAAHGGILDDLMVARPPLPEHEGMLSVVFNAACKVADRAHVASLLPEGVALRPPADLGLLALQGPQAVSVLTKHDPSVAKVPFMAVGAAKVGGIEVGITRSGYTGEDGFELIVPLGQMKDVWSLLLADERVRPIGLGARDSLRLEAGLCLYGHDIDTTTSPVEAGLAWSIQRRRRAEGGFPGAARIQRELAEGPSRLRVGIRPEGRAPAREGTEILSGSGERIGTVTSGGFGPSVNGPIAMGYVAAAFSSSGTKVQLMVRGKPLDATVVSLPFVPNRFVRKP